MRPMRFRTYYCTKTEFTGKGKDCRLIGSMSTTKKPFNSGYTSEGKSIKMEWFATKREAYEKIEKEMHLC